MTPEVFQHYKIGVPVMDDGHWAIIQKLNEARDIAPAASIATVIKLINEAIEFLHQDFIEEEQWMKDIDYPYAAEHRRAHHKLTLELDNVKRRIETTSSSGIAYAISDWQRSFVTQIDQHDFQLVNYSKVLGAAY